MPGFIIYDYMETVLFDGSFSFRFGNFIVLCIFNILTVSGITLPSNHQELTNSYQWIRM